MVSLSPQKPGGPWTIFVSGQNKTWEVIRTQLLMSVRRSRKAAVRLPRHPHGVSKSYFSLWCPSSPVLHTFTPPALRIMQYLIGSFCLGMHGPGIHGMHAAQTASSAQMTMLRLSTRHPGAE